MPKCGTVHFEIVGNEIVFEHWQGPVRLPIKLGQSAYDIVKLYLLKVQRGTVKEPAGTKNFPDTGRLLNLVVDIWFQLWKEYKVSGLSFADLRYYQKAQIRDEMKPDLDILITKLAPAIRLTDLKERQHTSMSLLAEFYDKYSKYKGGNNGWKILVPAQPMANWMSHV